MQRRWIHIGGGHPANCRTIALLAIGKRPCAVFNPAMRSIIGLDELAKSGVSRQDLFTYDLIDRRRKPLSIRFGECVRKFSKWRSEEALIEGSAGDVVGLDRYDIEQITRLHQAVMQTQSHVFGDFRYHVRQLLQPAEVILVI